jgi:hypothetical protein
MNITILAFSARDRFKLEDGVQIMDHNSYSYVNQGYLEAWRMVSVIIKLYSPLSFRSIKFYIMTVGCRNHAFNWI